MMDTRVLPMVPIFAAAGEILDEKRMSRRLDANDFVLKQLRYIALHALDAVENSTANATRNLRRILRLYTKDSFREFVDVPVELVRLVGHRSGGENALNDDSMDSSKWLELVRFLAEEADPADFLAALAMLETLPSNYSDIIPMLKEVLSRGASTSTELSSSLSKIRRARLRLGDLSRNDTAVDQALVDGTTQISSMSVWKGVATGILDLDKY